MADTTTDITRALVRATLGGERAVLEAFLDFNRAVIVRKVRGVADAEARRRRLPSATTLAGLVKHMIVVELNWFHRILAQQPIDLPGVAERDEEASFRLAADDTVDGLLAEYERTCESSRRIAAGLPLEHAVPHEHLGEVSLRWIYTHMIEETARHAGHADILRELTDGRTGLLG